MRCTIDFMNSSTKKSEINEAIINDYCFLGALCEAFELSVDKAVCVMTSILYDLLNCR